MQIDNAGAAIAFTYPEGDEDGGRVALAGFHVDLAIWNMTGKYIEECEDTSHNSLQNALTRWKSDYLNTPDDKTDDRFLNNSDKIKDTNDWYLRREVAWASHLVPDNSLPPIYGKSQVVDIDPLLQEDEQFLIKCCVGHYNNDTWNTTNLSLYYRYNGENSSYTWTNWTYYNTITSAPYRFTFNTSNANGTGRYEFCSILKTIKNVSNGETWEPTYYNETFPPGADAWCGAGGSILSCFSYEPGTPYVYETVHFTSEALTQENTHITGCSWVFGDGEGIDIIGGAANVTHSYSQSGTYTVNLTIINNLSQQDTALLNITILNNPPQADYRPNHTIAFIDQQINFTDESIDIDGTITNYTWDFGDGTQAYTQDTNHTYTTQDYYTVSLTVTDDENDSDTETKPLNVLIINTLVNSSLPADIPSQHQFRTIQSAINHSTTGDIIYVLSGTYQENLVINKSLTFIGENQDNTIIQGSVSMTNPHDYELSPPDEELRISMNGTELLMHFNNDTTVGEHYHNSTIVYDYSGQHHNGTNQGATWTTDTIKGDGCFDFNGTNNAINLTCLPGLSTENVTVSAWIYWDGGSGNLDPIISQVDSSGQGYCLCVNTTTDTPFFQLNDTKTVSSSTLDIGWHHIVGTHNQTTLAIYVDGIQKSTAEKTGSGVQADCYIGWDNQTNYFSGCIDEITIWNRTLLGGSLSAVSSGDEIYRLYMENYGVYFYGFSICDSIDVGMQPGNHTEVSNCIIHDTPLGVLLHDVHDVRLYNCNISNSSVGVSINNSCPDEYNQIRIVDCVIDAVTHAILVNDSANISFVGGYVHGSLSNITFWDSAFLSMDIFCINSLYNLDPQKPSLSGPTLGDPDTSYTYTACTNDSNNDSLLYFFDWGDGGNSGWLGLCQSNESIQASHTWDDEGGYYVRVKARDIFYNESAWSDSVLFKTETEPPVIVSVDNSPDAIGFGGTVNITANVTDNVSGVNLVKVRIAEPGMRQGNYTMTHVSGDLYHYVFDVTWETGRYNFSVWAMDYAYNGNSSSVYSFNVSADATISIATLQDSYTSTEYINITDPPNPPEDFTLVASGETWNEYYDAASGNNILESYAGVVNYQEENGIWTPINTTFTELTNNHPAYTYGYRTGNNRGLYGAYFKPNTQDNWPVAFTYDRTDDTTTDVIGTKLMGVGYLDPQNNWAYHYLQDIQSSQGQINENTITYPDVFTGTDVTWSYSNFGLKEEIILSNTTRTMLQTHPPSQYGLHDASSYLVFITKLDYQNLNMYNASGLLTGDVTISDHGVDLKDALGLFKCAMPLGDAYEQNNIINRQKLTYRIIHVNGETYLLAGLRLADLNLMTFPVVIDPTLTVYSSTADGYIYASGSNYLTTRDASSGTVEDTANAFYIGQLKFKTTYTVHRGFVFFNTTNLPSNAYIDSAVLSLCKYSDSSSTDFSLIVQNGQPTYPHSPLQTTDYNKNYYSGNGGSLNTSGFTTGYNNITLNDDGKSWLNSTGWTKFCIRSNKDINGTAPTNYEFVLVYSSDYPYFGCAPRLVITYRNQSKIKNTGSTDIKGYLLIQIQYNNSGTWILDNDTINETTPRTITSGNQLALDIIFNGNIRASDLTHGNGTYRVYAAFRDEDGDVLQTNDETMLEAWWTFSKT